MYQSAFDEETHLALVRGKIDPDTAITVRVHSECLTGDVFGSRSVIVAYNWIALWKEFLMKNLESFCI